MFGDSKSPRPRYSDLYRKMGEPKMNNERSVTLLLEREKPGPRLPTNVHGSTLAPTTFITCLNPPRGRPDAKAQRLRARQLSVLEEHMSAASRDAETRDDVCESPVAEVVVPVISARDIRLDYLEEKPSFADRTDNVEDNNSDYERVGGDHNDDDDNAENTTDSESKDKTFITQQTHKELVSIAEEDERVVSRKGLRIKLPKIGST